MHRCLVTDSSNVHEPIMLTQTDILRYIHAHFNEFSPIPFQISNKTLVSVTTEATALDAFQLLIKHKLSAVPIVRSDGTLVGAFSHSDLRGMTSHNLTQLSLPIMEYSMKNIVTCPVNTSLKQVLDLLVKHHAHRVWVVDAEQKPVNVITLSDILAKFE
jgi:CBS domain-containing protein